MQRFRQLIIILLITYALGQAAEWITSSPVFQIAFPQSITLQDFHWEDFVFKFREVNHREDRITLINISEGSRREIAEQIELLSRYQPRVIGLDALFINCFDSLACPNAGDTVANRKLSDAIRLAGNVVLSARLHASTSGLLMEREVYDSLELSDVQFRHWANYGFSNLVTSSDLLSGIQCRSYCPMVLIDKTLVYSFGVAVARMYDSIQANKQIARFTEEEILSYQDELINFRGNAGTYSYSFFGQVVTKGSYFDVLDYDDLMGDNFSDELIRDRIVLLGYLGEEYLADPAFEERFFTPLNPTLAGRSMPDMLGLVIHANIISMILNEDYINQLSPFWDFMVMVVVIVLNILFFMKLLQRNSVWYDSLCFLIPVVQIVVISWLRIELLGSFNFRLDLEDIIYYLAFVTFAINIYFGPWKALDERMRLQLNRWRQKEDVLN